MINLIGRYTGLVLWLTEHMFLLNGARNTHGRNNVLILIIFHF